MLASRLAPPFAVTLLLLPLAVAQVLADSQAKTLSNAKQLATATQLYLSDNDEVFPPFKKPNALHGAILPYVRNNKSWQSLNPKGGTFQYNLRLAAQEIRLVKDPGKVPLFFEPNAWADGTRAVAFADGHAKFVSASDWKGMQKYLQAKKKKVKKH